MSSINWTCQSIPCFDKIMLCKLTTEHIMRAWSANIPHAIDFSKKLCQILRAPIKNLIQQATDGSKFREPRAVIAKDVPSCNKETFYAIWNRDTWGLCTFPPAWRELWSYDSMLSTQIYRSPGSRLLLFTSTRPESFLVASKDFYVDTF